MASKAPKKIRNLFKKVVVLCDNADALSAEYEQTERTYKGRNRFAKLERLHRKELVAFNKFSVAYTLLKEAGYDVQWGEKPDLISR